MCTCRKQWYDREIQNHKPCFGSAPRRRQHPNPSGHQSLKACVNAVDLRTGNRGLFEKRPRSDSGFDSFERVAWTLERQRSTKLVEHFAGTRKTFRWSWQMTQAASRSTFGLPRNHSIKPAREISRLSVEKLDGFARTDDVSHRSPIDQIR